MVKLANPLRKIVCPLCGEEYNPGNCAIVSNSGQVLQDAHKGFLARAFITPLDGRKLIKAQAQRQCPSCGGKLPPNDDHVKNYTIAIVGDSVSGKSHYLASCIHQLKQDHALQVIGCSSVIGLGDTDTIYYNTYYAPIYLSRKKIPITQQGLRYPPLIYELVFPERSALQPAKTINLLFYDSSGEDIIEQRDMVLYSEYILNASAIIFLADPMQMPGVVNALPNHLKPTPDLVRWLTTSEVLNRVLETFKRSQRIRPGQKLKTPIAITVSKSDLLKFVAKGRQSPLFLNDNVYANQLDLPKFNYISNEVQTFLYSVGDRVLLRSSELFEDACYFAVSATGWPPDENGEFPPLEPLRCLDPLLWALWRLGIINVG